MPGRGSVFSIELPRGTGAMADPPENCHTVTDTGDKVSRRPARILVVENDGEIAELLALQLKNEGRLTICRAT